MSIENVSILQRLSWLANLIFHQGIAVITVYILSTIFIHHDIKQALTWHAVLCTLGFMFLATEGLILWNQSNLSTLFIPKSNKLKFHITLLGLGTASVVGGIILQIANKSSHFTTVHGVLGLITLILILLVVILGVIASQAKHLQHIARPVIFKFVHNCFGVLTIIIGITTLYFGLEKQTFSSFTDNDTIVTATVIMYLLVFWSCSDAFQSMYHHVKSIFSK